jgi:hypothetical protein
MACGPRIAFAPDDSLASGAGAGETQADALDALHTAVVGIESAADSAIALITNLAAQLHNMASVTPPDDLPAVLQSFANSLTDKSNLLASAIMANLPTGPTLMSGDGGAVGELGPGALPRPLTSSRFRGQCGFDRRWGFGSRLRGSNSCTRCRLWHYRKRHWCPDVTRMAGVGAQPTPVFLRSVESIRLMASTKLRRRRWVTMQRSSARQPRNLWRL